MWLGEPALILAISTAVLGVLFAIRRILARAPVETSSDRTASDVRESRGIAGVIAPPPLIFLGFLALAAVHVGLAIAAGSAWAIMLLVPLLAVMNIGVISREERYLESRLLVASKPHEPR
jgi:protein-S-isoprenylcysteine O-methyltransferase Ste14